MSNYFLLIYDLFFFLYLLIFYLFIFFIVSLKNIVYFFLAHMCLNMKAVKIKPVNKTKHM